MAVARLLVEVYRRRHDREERVQSKEQDCKDEEVDERNSKNRQIRLHGLPYDVVDIIMLFVFIPAGLLGMEPTPRPLPGACGFGFGFRCRCPSTASPPRKGPVGTGRNRCKMDQEFD